LVAAVEEDFGIPIQHYVELNFDSFANVVDALGGIHMYFPVPVFDAWSGLKVLTPGCKFLSGVQALQVVRARHLQYQAPGDGDIPQYWTKEAESDLARIRRDHEFLRVLATAIAKRGIGNPLTDQALIAAVAPQLKVDSGFSATHMVGLVLTFHGVDVNKAPQLTLPVAVDQFGSYNYKGGYYGDIEFPVEPLDQQVIDRFLGVSAGTDTMNGGALPNPSHVTVSVMNGTGVTDQATTTAAALHTLGFQIATLGDVDPVGQYAETVVYYRSLTPANEAAAQVVAQSLSGSVVLARDPSMVSSGAQVTVVTGSNFAVNPPTAAPSTSAGSAGGSGTGATTPTTAPPVTTTTVSSNGAFSAPTQSNQALASWDPRSCTPSGGEGP
jgi:LCP family protein required for cell wall assembly